MRLKKFISIVLVGMLVLSMLIGCQSGVKKNEDDNTLTVTIAANRATEFCDAMVKKFPEINFEFDYYYGENMSGYLTEVINHGDGSDLIYYTQMTNKESFAEHLLDLSGYPFIGNLNDEILTLLNVDDKIYQIPAPLEVRCIIYNKTLFAEKGWKIPENFQELVALCKQIRAEEPGITPIATSLGGEGYPFLMVSILSQCGKLSTPEGLQWEKDFFAGEASIEEGMSEGLTMTEQLIDAGAFDPEPYIGKWNCNEQMVKREAAMEFHWANMLSFMEAINQEGVTDEFGFLPFYGLNEGEKLVGFASSLTWSLNKKLGEEGNEKKLENALKVMEWITTQEAQQALSSNQGQIPVIKGVTNELIDSYMAELWELSKNGYKANGLYIGYEHIIVDATATVKEAMFARTSEGMRKNFVETCDLLNRKFLAGDMSEAYGILKEDFSSEEIAQLHVNMLHELNLGDFAMVTRSGRKGTILNTRGATGSLYAGSVTMEDIRVILSDAGGFVTTIELTGAQVKELLENGKKATKKIVDTDGNESANFEYYWAGIDVTMEDNNVTSVKLNGKELDDNTVYTVVFEEDDYNEELSSNAVVSDRLVSDSLVDYVKKNTPLTPPKVLR